MKKQWKKRRYLLAFGVAVLGLGAWSCNGDGGSDSRKCSAGHHMLESGACEKNTHERCGKPDSTVVVDCTRHGNATAGICNTAGECVATACEEGYRPSQGQCVEDNLSACTKSDDCADLPGWAGGRCEDGRCMATHCAVGYCLQNDICTNGKSNVAACGIAGGEQACRSCSADESTRCVDGQCQATPCASTECYYQGSACLNGDNHCGSECVNCNEANHASKGTCNNDTGICTITACQEDYHLDEKDGKVVCIPDSAKACGSSENDCTELVGWMSGSCIQQECVANECSPGYHLANGVEGECVEDTLEHCGAYENNCTEITGWEEGTCTDGRCELTLCDFEFCLSDNACVEGRTNAAACGTNGESCRQCLEGEECVAGRCLVPQCQDSDSECTQFRGVRDVACTYKICQPLFCEDNYTLIKTSGFWRNDICKADCGGVEGACAANEVCVGDQCRCTGGSGCSASQRCCLIKGSTMNTCVDEAEIGDDAVACP